MLVTSQYGKPRQILVLNTRNPIRKQIMPIVIANPVLPTSWTLNNVSYDSEIVAADFGTNGLTFDEAGTKMYTPVDVGTPTDRIDQYNLSGAWDLSTSSGVISTKNINTQDSQPRCVGWSDDGTKMYVLGINSDTISTFTASTPWLTSSATYDGAGGDFVIAADGLPYCFRWQPGGDRFYVAGVSNKKIYYYDTASSWVVAGATWGGNVNSLDVVSEEGIPTSMAFKPDGSTMFMTGINTGPKVYQYSLPTAWELSDAVYTGLSYDLSADYASGNAVGIVVNPDGDKMFIASGSSGNGIRQFSL